MNIRLVVASAVLALGLMPREAEAQVPRCEFCAFGECEVVDSPKDCDGLYARNSCSCYPYCNCTNGDPCEEETCEPSESPVAPSPLQPLVASLTLDDGWELDGLWLRPDAFGLLTKCGGIGDVFYSEEGIADREQAARTLTFIPPS